MSGLCLALLATSALRADTISTPLNDWGGYWGPADQLSYGQSFIVPASTVVLESFTFAYLTTQNNVGFDYYATLYAFDGTHATGSALWTSDVKAISIQVPFNDPAPAAVAFAPDIELTAGSSYIFIVTTAGLSQPGNTGQARIGLDSTSSYADGQLLTQDTAGNPANLTTLTWNSSSPSYDAAFSAMFIAVPEPSGIGLAFAGLALLIGRLRAAGKSPA